MESSLFVGMKNRQRREDAVERCGEGFVLFASFLYSLDGNKGEGDVDLDFFVNEGEHLAPRSLSLAAVLVGHR